jgi:Ca2+-transporting ATPase
MPADRIDPIAITDPVPGLTAQEAAQRLQADGPNEMPGAGRRSMLRMLAGVLLEPMFLLLLVAAGLYLLLGDLTEAVFLLLAVVAVIVLSLYQEQRTERALEALRDLAAPRALVVRDGQRIRIASREVVVGDCLVMGEGDRIPADAILLRGTLSANESLLTGEPAPVRKLPGTADSTLGTPGDEGGCSLFASALVTGGQGLARVCATGPRTATGAIGRSLSQASSPVSSLQRESRRVVRWMASAGIGAAVALAVLAWWWNDRSPVEAVLMGLALAMALLPEEVPLVLAVFLAIGAWRLSQRQVLVRQVQAVESLGGISVLAVDKTGTLTLNRMEVAALQAGPQPWLAGGEGAPEGADLEIAAFARMATPTDPFDPMETAIRDFADRWVRADGYVAAPASSAHDYPITPEILAMTRVYARADPGLHVLATKGAPEAVADLCHMDSAGRDAVRRSVEALAARGLRVLAVARGEWRGEAGGAAGGDAHGGWPETQHDFSFTYLGLLAFVDPPRPEVPAAVAACQEAGIRVLMMTGDHPATARAIARQVGLPDGDVLTGAEMETLDDAALHQRLPAVQLCARLQPHHKLRLVRALQALGQRVGMTGDGVNDAPALAAADVGIAMGRRGTDVAREAADLVLLDDSFASIVEAIRHGRRIRANLRQAIRFIFAVHMPIVALALAPPLWHGPILLLPAHIVLFEMLIDPVCSLLFEAEPGPRDLMSRPPDQWEASPFALSNVGGGLLLGAGVAAIMIATAWWQWANDWAETAMRGSMFMALVFAVALLALVPRMGSRMATDIVNPWPARLMAAIGVLIVGLLISSWLRQALGVGALDGPVWLASVGMALVSAIWLRLSVRVGSAT